MAAKNTRATARPKAARSRGRELVPVPHAEVMRVAEQLAAELAKRGQATEPAGPGRPAARVIWEHHGAPVTPLLWMAAAEVATEVAHLLLPAGQAALILAGAGGVVAGVTAWRYRQNRPEPKRRGKRARRYALAITAAGTAWATAAAAAGWFGAGGLLHLALLAGGSLLAIPYWAKPARRPARPGGKPAGPPPPDPRQEEFNAMFCGPGKPLEDGAYLDRPAAIRNGWQATVELPRGKKNTEDVVALARRIASLYGVPPDQVVTEPPPGREAHRALLTVLESSATYTDTHLWDGRSTYDPATGTFQIGSYIDGQRTHVQLHAPRSGACHALVAGTTGAGKSGLNHRIIGEASAAVLCERCGAAGTCPRCQLARICGVWLADPQMQSLPPWIGKTDCTALGLAASLHMLRMGYVVMLARSAYLSQVRWTDRKGRPRTGKGWFDPTPAFPLLLLILEEAPLLLRHPEYGAEAIWLIGEMGKAARKAGIGLILDTQVPDLTQLGEQVVRAMLVAFNAICLRTGEDVSAAMVGVAGRPFKLPKHPGLGYINSIDNRPGAIFKADLVPEEDETGSYGIDAYDIAERQLPFRFDDTTRAAAAPFSYTGGGQVFDDMPAALLKAGQAALAAALKGSPASNPAPAAPLALPAAPALAAPAASLGPVLKAHSALTTPGGTDLYDVMTASGLSLLEARRALDELATAGHATQVGPGRYTRT
jgi:hypothetical protein